MRPEPGMTIYEGRRPAGARQRRLRAGLLALAFLVVLVIGLALGDALGDRPARARLVSIDRDVSLITVTQSVAAVTRTVVVTGSGP